MRRFPRDADTERLLDDFLAHQEAVLGMSGLTVRNHRSSVRNFAAWWRANGGADHRSVTVADLEAWLIAEAESGASARTREGRLYSLRAWFRWLDPDGLNPAEQVRRPRIPPSRVRIYRPDEAHHILATLAARGGVSAAFDHAVIATLRWTGIRRSELTGLRYDRLDLDERRAKVVGKGSKPRTVPLPVPLVEVLGRYLADVRPRCPASPLVFANPRAVAGSGREGTTDDQGVRELCARAGRRAGVPGPHHPHRWRHSYATELLRGGIDLHVVQRLLGHTSLETTTRYLHLLDHDLRRAIDRTYPPRARPLPPAPTCGQQLSLANQLGEGCDGSSSPVGSGPDDGAGDGLERVRVPDVVDPVDGVAQLRIDEVEVAGRRAHLDVPE
ncbi:MAG: tyrosine-type recombinase/integrase [Nitriliruptor sp.]|uniref:tyrosine-type recombinase/integrase n=1 Tax=Nitriliruptor sp. TaxID=2448056 RepID=UPI0034A068DD